MAQQYIHNISIAGLTLDLNPEQYEHAFMFLGEYKRTCGGGIVEVDVGGRRLLVNISGITQSQVEEIKKRMALFGSVDFIDYIPIAEKTQITRTVYENISSEVIESQLIYLYIPIYKIIVTDYTQEYGGNVVSYKITGEEI